MSNEEFVREAIGIVSKAQENGACLRIMGALAAYIRAVNVSHSDLFNRVRRFGDQTPLFTDLDFATYGKHSSKTARTFKEFGFKPDLMVNGLFGSKRLIYYHPQGKYHVDIFIDNLEFSHNIPFGKPGTGRLELDYPTITPSDLVLEKLQIHQINHKDLVDLIVIFITHSVTETPQKGSIDGRYIGQTLANDWGFWYDATTNLSKVEQLSEQLTANGRLNENENTSMTRSINDLTNIVTNTPKTRNWEKRARAGTNKRWYNDVEEVTR
jgi:hypothetical protein